MKTCSLTSFWYKALIYSTYLGCYTFERIKVRKRRAVEHLTTGAYVSKIINSFSFFVASNTIMCLEI